MSEIDLQLGGGYTYQWECAILLALNCFTEQPDNTHFVFLTNHSFNPDLIRVQSAIGSY